MDVFIKEACIELCPSSTAEIEMAYVAFSIYSKRQNHRAQINFSDLFSYALAKSRGNPLLYKAKDFTCTYMVSAV